MMLPVGAEIDGWRIERRIGQGSMGTVFEARRAGVRAALKVIRGDASDREQLGRFRREARVLLGIEHPHVVRCLATGDAAGGGVYLALEYLEGGSLQDLVDRRGRLPLPQAVGAARGILAGLGAIHAQGIVHRDVKPANVLVDPEGRVKLADFGLARAVEGSSVLTQTGTILGTPFYMAPELIRGQEVGPSIDIYAAGATLWVLLVGEPPYPGDNPLKVLQAHLREPVPDLRHRLAGAPERLAQALDALLAKHPDDRPRTAAEALALLEGLPVMAITGGGDAPASATGPDPPAAPQRSTAALQPSAEVQADDATRARRTSSRSTLALEALAESRRQEVRKTSSRTAARGGPGPTAPSRPSGSAESLAAGTGVGERVRTTERRRRQAAPPGAAAPAPGREAPPSAADGLPTGPISPRPLPAPRRSRWWGRLVALAVLLAGVHAGDLVLRARGVDLLADGDARLIAWEDALRAGPAPDAFGLQAAPWLRATLGAAGRGRGWVDLHLAACLGVVAALALERALARALRYGLLERLVLRRRAARLVRAGEVHQAALVWEDLGDRVRGGRLLLAHGLAALAADMFVAAGRLDEARAARAQVPAPATRPGTRPATRPGGDGAAVPPPRGGRCRPAPTPARSSGSTWRRGATTPPSRSRSRGACASRRPTCSSAPGGSTRQSTPSTPPGARARTPATTGTTWARRASSRRRGPGWPTGSRACASGPTGDRTPRPGSSGPATSRRRGRCSRRPATTGAWHAASSRASHPRAPSSQASASGWPRRRGPCGARAIRRPLPCSCGRSAGRRRPRRRRRWGSSRPRSTSTPGRGRRRRRPSAPSRRASSPGRPSSGTRRRSTAGPPSSTSAPRTSRRPRTRPGGRATTPARRCCSSAATGPSRRPRFTPAWGRGRTPCGSWPRSRPSPSAGRRPG
ncbi:MAG: protein kinase [Planctomycetes bacterium]|nr:protein kinase [Planctomycetota bacterium]